MKKKIQIHVILSFGPSSINVLSRSGSQFAGSAKKREKMTQAAERQPFRPQELRMANRGTPPPT